MASSITLTTDSTFIRSRDDGERHLEVQVGNVETADGRRRVFGAVARSETDIAVLIRESLDAVGRTASTMLADFRRLGSVSGVALLALQKGPKTGQAGGWFGRAPLVNLGAEIADYEDIMAILANLERVVTVDTSVAHLAAAMGRPVWITSPRAPDWRWLLDRDDSPWYPTVRLFRQTSSRRWDDVLERIVAALS